jgi:hypothetical protein
LLGHLSYAYETIYETIGEQLSSIGQLAGIQQLFGYTQKPLTAPPQHHKPTYGPRLPKNPKRPASIPHLEPFKILGLSHHSNTALASPSPASPLIEAPEYSLTQSNMAVLQKL